MEETYDLDEQEEQIARKLIRNPRLSDNAVSRLTGIPVKSVNRKRKKLEEKGILNYMAYLDHSEKGSGKMPARQMHIIKFKEGITRKSMIEALQQDQPHEVMKRHVHSLWLGEQQGRLIMGYLLESYQMKDLLEIFNAEIVPWLHKHFGDRCIKDIQVIDVTAALRLFHNYLPEMNIEKGRIKEDWPDELIFTQ